MKKKMFFIISTAILFASMFLATPDATAATSQSNLTEDDFQRLAQEGLETPQTVTLGESDTLTVPCMLEQTGITC